MIFLNLEDGLGNQLFQYAFARSLQEKYKEPLVISLVQYNKKNHVCPEMKYALQEFRIPENVIFIEGYKGYVVRWWTIIKEWFYRLLLYPIRKDRIRMTKIANRNGLYFDFVGYWIYAEPCASKRNNKFITGRFQSEKYFKDIRELLKSELVIRRDIKEKVNQYMCDIKKDYDRTVAVHIRRGDYLLSKNRGMLVCGEEYYSKALAMMCEKIYNPIFYIFSGSQSDRDWIKSNYLFLERYNCIFVDAESDAIDDLMLISKCKNFILSNSSFGWWAQFLSEDKGEVIVPSHWNSDNHKDKDVYRAGWTKIM